MVHFKNTLELLFINENSTVEPTTLPIYQKWLISADTDIYLTKYHSTDTDTNISKMADIGRYRYRFNTNKYLKWDHKYLKYGHVSQN